MNDYIVKIIHPEWGSQGDLPSQGSNAHEALESAVGPGTNGSYGTIMTAYVKNIRTGFTVRIEFTFD